MLRSLLSSILLLVLTIIICCGVYPLTVWAIGKVFFPFQADGSLLKGPDGSIVGSKLIAQPFTKDEYFQPRPSAASYDASASASSTYAASNYLLRNRVATLLGPIVKYQSGPKAGQLVAPDLESWFQQDKFRGNPHLVAQWADLHNAVAQAWVNADPTHGQYVDAWSKAHPDLVAKWIKDNPAHLNRRRRIWRFSSSSTFPRSTPVCSLQPSPRPERTVSLKAPFNRSRMDQTFSRISSICGARTTPMPICRTFQVIW